MGGCLHLFVQSLLQDLDLGIRKRNGFPTCRDKSDDTGYFQDLESFAKWDVNEEITGKERKVYSGETIFPAVLSLIERKEEVYVLAGELVGNAFFMTRTDMSGVPMDGIKPAEA